MRLPMSPRRRAVLGIGLAGGVACGALAVGGAGLSISEGGKKLAWDMASAALDPAWDFTIGSDPVPRSLLPEVGAMALRTVTFAVAAVGAALPLGLGLGFAASRRATRLGGRLPGALARFLAAALRSVHELLWAVLFLAAMGLSDGTAVLALALPYAGIFAKIFAEMLDEAPMDVAVALRWSGAGALGAILWGVLPRVLPDFGAYVFYRFECALRSSAVLGFFGFQTLGYGIAVAFENLRYDEMWTHLYALLILILIFDRWSARLRRGWVGGPA